MKTKNTIYAGTLLLPSLLVAVYAPLQAATLTVGSGQQYTTISAALTAAAAGDTISVMPGSYGALSISKSGSSGKPITIHSATQYGAVLKSISFSASFVTVDGFDMDSSAACGSVDMEGSNDTVSNNKIHRSMTNDPCSPNSTGLFFVGSGANNNTILNNEIYGAAHDGIDLWENNTGTTVQGNYIHDLKADSSADHVDVLQTYCPDGGCTNITIADNYAVNYEEGILIKDAPSSNLSIHDNVMAGPNDSGWDIYVFQTTTANVSHNTAGTSILFDTSSGNTGITCTNNIIKSQLQISGGTESYNLVGGGASGSHDISGTPTFTGGASPTTWAGFKLAAGSKGLAAASDAKDMGSTYFGTGTVGSTPIPPTINSATTATGKVGTVFSYSITATNSPTSFSATGLPAGLSVNATSGVISGTPTAAGTSSVALKATNSGGSGTATLTLTISAATVAVPVINSATTATGKVGTAFSYSITATNTPTSYSATGLPAGLSVNATSGLISGTPTAAGTSSVALKATNAGGSGTATLTLTISAATVAAPVINSATTATGKVGTAFSYSITATNSPTSFSATGLPAGLSVNATSGLISGTPTAAGTSSVALKATNSGGSGTATLTLTISAATVAAPVINSATTATGKVGTAFSYSIKATNSPTSFSATGLPAGLSVNATSGVISGTPTAAGTSSVTLKATNAGGSGTAVLTLTISAATVTAPVINSATTATGTVGAAFSYQITATNSPTSYKTTALPAGISVNATSGLISGTPSAAAATSVTISAVNSGGTGNATLVITINAAATGESLFTTQTPASTGVSDGTGINYELGMAFQTAVAGKVTAIRFWKDAKETGTHTGHLWSASGTLLASVTFANETASGWQSQLLTTPVSLTANTAYVTSVNTGNTFYVATTNGLASAIVHQDLSSVVGSNGKYGAPGVFPTSTFQSSNYFRDIVFVASAGSAPVPAITSKTTATGTVGTAFSYQITATNTPTSYKATGLPAGLSLNATSGLISGTPSAAATSTISLGATNASGTGTASLTLTINTSSASGAITLIQMNSSAVTSALQIPVAFTTNVTAGHLIVASVSSWPNPPTGITDSMGNAYTLAGAVQMTSGKSYTATYYAKTAGSGADTLTYATGGSNGQMSMVISEFAGVSMTTPMDIAGGASGTGSASSSGNLMPSVSGDLLIGAGTHDATTVTTAGSGFTMVDVATEDGSTHQSLAMEYKVLSSVASSAANFTLGTSVSWAQSGVLFKSAASTPAVLLQAPMVNLNVRVFPNPWRSDKHAGQDITFDQMPNGCEIKIFTLSGRLVKKLSTAQASVTWNRTNDSGDTVASGLYIYLVKDSMGNTTRGKLAIIK